MLDVVYPLKRDNGSDEELRYSLRSLSNVPHGRVFLVGGRPAWGRDIVHIPTENRPTKYKDASNNIVAACEHPDISDPFILMNDDFFILRKINRIPVFNRGKVQDVIREYEAKGVAGVYLQGMRDTFLRLQSLGYEDPLSFEMHVPMVVHKQSRLKAIEIGSDLPVWHARTAYGALNMLTGETVNDVKIYTRYKALPKGVFASSSDDAFAYGKIGLQLRNLFRKPSPYESREDD